MPSLYSLNFYYCMTNITICQLEINRIVTNGYANMPQDKHIMYRGDFHVSEIPKQGQAGAIPPHQEKVAAGLCYKKAGGCGKGVGFNGWRGIAGEGKKEKGEQKRVRERWSKLRLRWAKSSGGARRDHHTNQDQANYNRCS